MIRVLQILITLILLTACHSYKIERYKNLNRTYSNPILTVIFQANDTIEKSPLKIKKTFYPEDSIPIRQEVLIVKNKRTESITYYRSNGSLWKVRDFQYVLPFFKTRALFEYYLKKTVLVILFLLQL
ncbi:MAG: hypothetical protein ACI83B_001739 [Sediminicola sp.]|jgi:type III secretory pathway lipoprotein EscJ